jgi:putative transcriptional regulator
LQHTLNIAALRKELHLSQKEFSDIYHIKLETLRNWEQGKRFPDTTSLAYLTCIAQNPKAIKKMLGSVA